MILRAACYERVSTEEQALHGYSIETQIDTLNDYCKKQNIKVLDHYTDEGISGAKPPLKRPELNRLLSDVESGKVDIILFTKLDRWFRSVKEYFKVQEILDKYNVEWKAINEDYDTTTANGKMAITIFLAVAQNERDRTSERIKTVFNNRVSKGEYCYGGTAYPFGYIKKYNLDGSPHLVKDPETKEATEEFWRILLSTYNLSEAIRVMFHKYGINKDWKSWKKISTNELYYGKYKGFEGFCDPYITEEEFVKYNSERPVKVKSNTYHYLFRGMIRCNHCGNYLCGSMSSSKKYATYRCTRRYKQCDFNTTISERKIEKQLLENINAYISDYLITIKAKEKPIRCNRDKNINRLNDQLRRLTVVYMAGNMSDEEYLSESKQIKKLISLEKPPTVSSNTSKLQELLDSDFNSVYSILSREEKCKFWRDIIKEIKLDENKNITEIIFF